MNSEEIAVDENTPPGCSTISILGKIKQEEVLDISDLEPSNLDKVDLDESHSPHNENLDNSCTNEGSGVQDDVIKFSVNQGFIEGIRKEDQADELRELGLSVFDQDVYEKGVIAQVKAFTGETEDAEIDENEEGEIGDSHIEDPDGKLGGSVKEKGPRDSISTIEDYLRKQLELQATQKHRIRDKPQNSKNLKTFKSSLKPGLSSPKEFKKFESKKRKKETAYVGPSLKKKKKKEKLGTRKGHCPRSVEPATQPGEDSCFQPSDENEDFYHESDPDFSLDSGPSSVKRKERPKVKRTLEIGGDLELKAHLEDDSGSEYVPSDSDYSDEEKSNRSKTLRALKTQKKPRREYLFYERPDTDDSDWDSDDDLPKSKGNKELDDGDPDVFGRRMKNFEKSDYDESVESIDGNFILPKDIWDNLFDYQIKAVRWFWTLDQQLTGGILGDEMGLGKTVQVIAFLAGLHRSSLRDEYSRYKGLGPTLIVCPTTVMHQWVREFHKWYPPVRVAILHDSGTYKGKDRTQLVHTLCRDKFHGVVITSYTGLVQYKETILPKSWHYVILDEGHKIRNTKAKVTETAKMLDTPHRLILSGSPLQNNLQEFWCLFDFVCPGRLGSQQVFMETFAIPIMQGGYANASETQVVTAHKCATILKDTITPFLLRRMKEDVGRHINLPDKKEQVLFCRLSDEQRTLYKEYVETIDVQEMVRGRAKIFVALINMRKICNHPDLYSGGPQRNFRISSGSEVPNEYHFGYWKRAGKMIVVESLLKIWSEQGHRVLLFTQSKKMLLLMEDFVKRKKYKYLKLDGQTSVAARQPLIDKFNQDESYFLMLLTTKVGGLGVNLTGANRVVIYDPDWNPATDTQARERAWRIGQKKDVTIYRLITAGTIEEKIYHRQIFKQFLSNKILKDPKQRRFFKSNDLLELFTLSETVKNGTTETAAIFAGTGSEVKIPKNVPLKMEVKPLEEKIVFTESKIEQMKKLAQQLSRKISETHSSQAKDPPSIQIDQNKKSNDKSIYGPDGSINIEAAHKAISTNSSSVDEKPSESVNGCEDSGSKAPEEDPPPIVLNGKDRHKHKKKKKKSGEKFATFEGKEVPHLVKKRKFKKSKDEEERDKHMNQDDYVLKKLFSKGIETVMRHDRIIDGGPSDYAIVEAEAERVAQSALKALKESHTQAQDFASLIKRKREKDKEGDDLLESIKKRNMEVEAGFSEQSLLSSMISWLQSQGGTSSTDQMIKAFRYKVGEGKTPLFKALLQKIATFFRGPDKVGYWTIRDEYNNIPSTSAGFRLPTL